MYVKLADSVRPRRWEYTMPAWVATPPSSTQTSIGPDPAATPVLAGEALGRPAPRPAGLGWVGLRDVLIVHSGDARARAGTVRRAAGRRRWRRGLVPPRAARARPAHAPRVAGSPPSCPRPSPGAGRC